MLKLCSKLRLNRFWVEIWRRKPSFSVKCGFLLKLSLKHTLTHNFNIKFNLKIIDLCELRRHFHIFSKKSLNFENWQQIFSIILTKSCHFYRKPEILRPFSRFLAVFRKISKKKQGRPFESSNFRLNPLALSTHAHVACLCACLHMHACTHVHRVVRARVSRV